MADSSGARDERIPLQHYKAALRLRYGPGRWRIERDGTIRALSGCWIVFGRVGDPQTVRQLFGRQRGIVAVEAAIILSVLVVALVAGCTTVDNAIRDRWPGVGLVEVSVELIDFAAERIKARQTPTEGGES